MRQLRTATNVAGTTTATAHQLNIETFLSSPQGHPQLASARKNIADHGPCPSTAHRIVSNPVDATAGATCASLPRPREVEVVSAPARQQPRPAHQKRQRPRHTRQFRNTGDWNPPRALQMMARNHRANGPAQKVEN